MRVLVAEPVAEAGTDLLRRAGFEVVVETGLDPAALEACIGDYDALVVRSATQVTAALLERGERLQVVGRAGIGVDNIDVDAATRRGVLVVNSPASNVIAAAEHTMALMLSLARNVPQADQSMRAGRWARTEHTGVQLRGKTLAVIGLGKVGSEVVRRANSFEMRVIGHDPFVSEEYARRIDVELVSMEEMLAQADFLTIHVPLTAGTQTLLGAAEFAKMKPDVRIINAARGGIVDEQALLDAVSSGHVGGAAVDTFSVEPATDTPLLKSDRIIVTPHLGASTREAQEQVSVDVAEQIIDVLAGKPAKFAVNAPMMNPEALPIIAPYVDVAHTVGRFATQLAAGQLESVYIEYAGEIARYDTLVLKAAVIQGLLAPISEERVNVVNADLVAAQRGLIIKEEKIASPEVYRSLLTVALNTSAGPKLISGASVIGRPMLVSVDEYLVDAPVGEGYMLFVENWDQPGLIGSVGTVAGAHDVNISSMDVGRQTSRDRAMMVLGLDEAMPEAALAEIRAMAGILSVTQVRV